MEYVEESKGSEGDRVYRCTTEGCRKHVSHENKTVMASQC